jgi:hypothetical protein
MKVQACNPRLKIILPLCDSDPSRLRLFRAPAFLIGGSHLDAGTAASNL